MRSILVYTFLLLLLAGCTSPPSPPEPPHPPDPTLEWNPACPDVSQVVITDSNGLKWHFCPDQIMDENGHILWQGDWNK